MAVEEADEWDPPIPGLDQGFIAECPLLTPAALAVGAAVQSAGDGEVLAEDRLGADVGAVWLAQLTCFGVEQQTFTIYLPEILWERNQALLYALLF